MAYETTVYPAKAWLKAALDAHTFPDDAPKVDWGGPTENEDVDFNMIYLGPTEVPENEYVTLGAGRTDETYRIFVFVDVYRYGDDEQATELRAWVLLNGVLTVIHADHTLGGTVNRVTGFRFRQVNPAPDEQWPHWRTQIQIEVAVVGLVTP